MRTFLKTLAIAVILSFIIFPLNSAVYSQIVSVHDLGKFHATIIDNGQQTDEGFGELCNMNYPQGMYRQNIYKLWWFLGIAEQWTDKAGTVIRDAVFCPRFDIGLGIMKAKSYVTYRRWAPPNVIVDGVDFSTPFAGQINNTLKPDILIDWLWKGYQIIGLEGNQKTYSFQNKNYDDFIIVDHKIKITYDYDDVDGQDAPDQTINFAWTEAPGFDPSEEGIQSYNQDWYSTESWWDVENYTSKLVTNLPRKNLIVTYVYNGDDENISEIPGTSGGTKILDESGYPDPKTGMFLSPQYMGKAVFYADKSQSEKVDDPVGQPKAVRWAEHGILWGGPGWWAGGSDYQFLADPTNRTTGSKNYFGNVSDASIMAHIQSFDYKGLKKGDEFKSVYALAGGAIDEDLWVSEGAKWWNWYWDLPGTKLDDAGKNALIATGKDSLLQNIDRAYLSYSRGYNVPDPPPAPDVTVTSGADKITVQWGYPNANMFKDPDTGIDDFKEWRLYRKVGAYYVDDPTDVGVYYKYQYIGSFPKATTSYVDVNVKRGINYHYCVTAVDDGTQNNDVIFPGQQLESSYYANRTKGPAIPYKGGLNVSDQVVIVPNPYSLSTGLENAMGWPGEPNQVVFMNLPAYCTLKIYTVTGELAKTIEHQSGSADEAWQYLRTDSNQYPASGVYILVIDNAKDLNKNPLPRKIAKFVIVR